MGKTNKWIPKFIGSVMIVHVKVWVVTSSGEPVIILKESPHNLHGPSVAQIEVKKSIARMKEAAAQGRDAPSRIVNRE